MSSLMFDQKKHNVIPRVITSKWMIMNNRMIHC